jgi:predicted GH43/DUF377 family glycosyl hydrolase
MPPEDKDAALFPNQFDGRWCLIHRPTATTPWYAARTWFSWLHNGIRTGFLRPPPQHPAHMAVESDLRQWHDHQVLLPAREGAWWDANKIGLSTPPLLTSQGWLTLYHGVRQTAAGSIYRTGLALLDTEHPERVLARSNEWMFGPETTYERTGDVDQVVFPCGWVLADDGDTLRIYYGAADTSVCVATLFGTLLDWPPHTPVASDRPSAAAFMGIDSFPLSLPGERESDGDDDGADQLGTCWGLQCTNLAPKSA